MEIKTKFNRLDEVKILPVDRVKGRIKSIWFNSDIVQYEVRYFINGEAKEIYFYEFELEVI